MIGLRVYLSPLTWLRAVRGAFFTFYTLLIKYGYLKSVCTRKVLDAKGDPIPLFSYPAIEFLQRLDLSTKTVFEWGAGFSTLFWANKARDVISVEHDKYWYEKIANIKPCNVDLTLYQDHACYVESIGKKNRKFDIIVVDGIKRNECVRIAIAHVKSGGLIILDDAQRKTLAASIDLLREHGFIHMEFSGFGPIRHWTSTTSFFVHKNWRNPELIVPIGETPIGNNVDL